MLWLGVHALLFLSFIFFATIKINTSLFAILPASNPVVEVAEAEKTLEQNISGTMTILLGHENFHKSAQAGDHLYAMLSGYFSDNAIRYKAPAEQFKEFQDFIYNYRYHLLDENTVSLIDNQDFSTLSADAFQKLMSPVTLVDMASLGYDPFLFSADEIQTVVNSGLMDNFSMTIRDGYLTRTFEDKHWILMQIDSNQGGFSIEIEDSPVKTVLNALTDLKAEYPDLEQIKSGIPFHSYDSALRSQNEIGIFSTISMLFIVIMVFFVFRSFKPLFATLLAIGVGIASGLAATLLAIGELHVFTIVFGTSLIGISVDYAFHYFTELAGRKPNYTVAEILPGISIGLITTVISYVAFFFTGFPFLQQMALFSMAGLSSTFLSVILIFPLFGSISDKGEVASSRVALFIQKTFIRLSATPLAVKAGLCAALGLIIIVASFSFSVDNNIKDFYTMSDDLKYGEMMSSRILDHNSAGVYFIIEGQTEGDVLSITDELGKQLDELVVEGRIKSYLSSGHLLAGPETVARKKSILSKKLPELARAQLAALGFSDNDFEIWNQDFEMHMQKEMNIASLADSPFKDVISYVWIGPLSGKVYSAVMLFGVEDMDAVHKIGTDNESLYVINKVADINTTIQDLSIFALYALLGAYTFIFLGLILRYRAARAFRIVAIPLLASVFILALLTLAQIKINLFVIMGIILVPGMGTDYLIFLTEGKNQKSSTVLAITMSMLTTILSFGMLSFTSFAAGFGITVAAGIFFSYMFTALFSNPLNHVA